MDEQSRRWWDSITGPRQLVMAINKQLHDRCNVLLNVPDDLPWRSDMRAAVELGFNRQGDASQFVVEIIDVQDECPDANDVGKYLLERYGTRAIASSFRRGSIQNFIIQNGILHHRILWIKGMNSTQAGKWVQFCRDYTP